MLSESECGRQVRWPPISAPGVPFSTTSLFGRKPLLALDKTILWGFTTWQLGDQKRAIRVLVPPQRIRLSFGLSLQTNHRTRGLPWPLSKILDGSARTPFLTAGCAQARELKFWSPSQRLFVADCNSIRLAGIVVPCIWRLLLRAGCGSPPRRGKSQDGTAGTVLVKENLQCLKVYENRSTWFQRLQNGPVNHTERDQPSS